MSDGPDADTSPAGLLRSAASLMREPVKPMMEWAPDRVALASELKFLVKVLRNVTIAESGCWLWSGTLDVHGYGKVSDGSESRGAHRWLWERLLGPVLDGLELDHLCRVKHCVNPEHLEPVTPAENIRRQHEDRGLYMCTKHGPKTPTPGGYFRCKPCRAEQARKRRARIARTEPPSHGTRSGYVNYACRCEPCCAAQAAYQAERRIRKQLEARRA